MNNDVGFQIVCTNCGCLSIRIEEPHKAIREADVYCGDCGSSRGTVGALRDLSVRQYSDLVFSMPAATPLINGHPASERRPVGEISKRYAELRRLRQQVEVAEWLARETVKPAAGRSRRRNPTYRGSSPTIRAELVTYPNERDRKRPS
jgi:hypothetical protein